MSVALLVVLAVVTLLARQRVRSPALGRLSALFPAWRFFDRAVGSPRLHVRVDPRSRGFTEWVALDALVARAPWIMRWAFAPRDNLALAYQAAVERLVGALGELDLEADEVIVAEAGDDGRAAERAPEIDPRVIGLDAYAQVTQIARAHVPAGARFQWKITVPGEPFDYLRSPVILS